MRAHRSLIMIGASLGFVSVPVSSAAGIITTVGTTGLPTGSTAIIGPAGVTPNPNNDNAAAPSANTIPYNVVFNAFGAMDVEFIVSDSGGTTEYRFPQSFTNNSGFVWSGFTFELGFGVSTAFVLSNAADLLDFDTPTSDPTPTSSAFSILVHGADTITWSGGQVPLGNATSFEFSVDVPDNLQVLNPSGLNRFTLRQTPIAASSSVPEPSTFWLLVPVLIALARNRCGRI